MGMNGKVFAFHLPSVYLKCKTRGSGTEKIPLDSTVFGSNLIKNVALLVLFCCCQHGDCVCVRLLSCVFEFLLKWLWIIFTCFTHISLAHFFPTCFISFCCSCTFSKMKTKQKLCYVLSLFSALQFFPKHIPSRLTEEQMKQVAKIWENKIAKTGQ